MENKEMRFLLPEPIWKRYKILCVELDISLPKQTAELIRHFVEVHEHNLNSIKQIPKE